MPRRALLLLCGLVVFLDAAGAYFAIGLFIGDELLAVAAIAFLAGAALLPSSLTNHEKSFRNLD